MVSASQRLLGRPKVKKGPATPEILRCSRPQWNPRLQISLLLFQISDRLPFALQVTRRSMRTEINLSEDLPISRALTTPRSKEKVRSRGISYTRVRELVKDAFRGLTAVSKIGVHSLRARGATSAANAGIPDRLVKR